MPDNLKRVAAIVTEYRRHSHADVIVGKILEGYNYDGRDLPRMHVVSMYVDQFPQGDMSRALARRHNFTIYRTPEEAVTLGGNRLAVDGVLIIGEHGTYPTNARGQILYPRRRFFEAVSNVFARSGRSVPVFSDKHLSATWQDARWVYDRARQLHVPFMAGSSVPVTWRRPPLALPLGSELVEAVQIGYGPFEGYGFHALEGLQCMVERRRGGETGVRAVQCVQGDEMWRLLDRGVWSRPLLEAAIARVPSHATGDYRRVTAQTRDAGLFLIEFRDGFKAAVAMLNGWLYEGDGGAFTFACQVRGRTQPLATHFYLQQPDPFAHFSYLVRAIDSMMQTNHPAYPVERTLLTTGILDAVMVSKAERNRRVPTPYLDVRYEPADWPFARDPVPRAINRPAP
jgi:hypothetical protein